MKEFDCQVSSTWFVWGKVRAEAFTHKHLRNDKKEELSQQDYIIGPMIRNDEIYIQTQEDCGQRGTTTLSSRDCKKNHTSKSFKKGTKVTGWKPTAEDHLMHLLKRK